MFVKPSHQKRMTHFTMAMLASVSMTACQSTTTSSWWRSITAEREPQIVEGPRRVPILNRNFIPTQPQSSPGNQYSPSYSQPHYAPDETTSRTSDESGNTAYDKVQAPLKDGQNQQPYLLDKISDWFSASLKPDAAGVMPNHHTLTLASNESNSVISTHNHVPPANRRKPIIGNLSAMRDSEVPPAITHVASVDANKRKAIGSNKLSSKPAPAEPAIEQAPVEITETVKQEVVLPWGKEAPLDKPSPITPSNPSELSALMPASGMRKEHAEMAEMLVEEVPEEEFSTLLNEGKVTHQMLAEAPADDVIIDLEQIDRALNAAPAAEPDSGQAPQPSVIARTNLIPHALEAEPQTSQIEEIPTIETVLAADSDIEVELATSDSLILAENKPEYPPLTSVPTVPERMYEIRKEHPEIKWQLEQEKTEAEMAREAVEQQLKEEADESLIQNLRSEPVSALTRPHPVAMLPLPAAQFDDPRWSGPRIAFFAPLPAAIPPMHAAAEPQMVLAKNEAAYDTAELQQTQHQEVVQLVDQQLQAAAEDISPPMVDAPAALATAELAAHPKPVAEGAALPPKQPVLANVARKTAEKAQKWADAAKHAFRKKDFKREVVGVFSVLPYYTYAPVLNENREVVYLADSRYSNYR